MNDRRCVLSAVFLACLATLAPPLHAAVPLGASFSATDSLDVGKEPIADARACLDGLVWPRETFAVSCDAPGEFPCDALVRFPSPFRGGDAAVDRVTMEWHAARDADGEIVKAPAVVVVHESGRRMPVGRLFAKGLKSKGVHAFMIHLPYYGARRGANARPDLAIVLTTIRQAIADVRRARDAVAALPLVDASHIALQGTSLGGFVAATTAGLDRGYDSVFIMLAGGNLYDVLKNGKRDAVKVREEFEKAGVTDEQLRKFAQQIEPTRLAHRYDPATTWLYSGKYDTVVPPESSLALAKAAGLEPLHHIQMSANHYSGIIYLPFVFTHIAQRIKGP